MLMRLIGIVLFTLVISGCATGPKKQTAQQSDYQGPSQIYQQNTSSWDYEDVQPAKSTTYSAPVNLSVRQIQKALKSAGFYQGAVDGKIGSKTKSAIIKFQKAHNLKADGVVGKRTSVELNKYLSK
ncbi:MAG: peptidoglycan-binding protein [Candidatus Omnitrophica bacterium]|nr:peptidoglycan-binding protein [Candidatus Omnitrophota bacterium]MBU4418666.1 peptidoglycan-binding protein [Candidatus Omnitrophota bacterium]